jgi:hypothetical protein
LLLVQRPIKKILDDILIHIFHIRSRQRQQRFFKKNGRMLRDRSLLRHSLVAHGPAVASKDCPMGSNPVQSCEYTFQIRIRMEQQQ